MPVRSRTLLALAATLALVAGGAVAFADAPIGRQAPPSPPLAKLARQMAAAGHATPNPPVPTVSQVGVPSYPGSWYLQARRRGSKIAEIDLVSPAPPSKVLAFYKKALKGKGYKGRYEAASKLHVLQKGGELSEWYSMSHPAVWIEPLKCDSSITAMFSKKICGRHHSKVKLFVPAENLPKAAFGL